MVVKQRQTTVSSFCKHENEKSFFLQKEPLLDPGNLSVLSSWDHKLVSVEGRDKNCFPAEIRAAVDPNPQSGDSTYSPSVTSKSLRRKHVLVVPKKQSFSVGRALLLACVLITTALFLVNRARLSEINELIAGTSSQQQRARTDLHNMERNVQNLQRDLSSLKKKNRNLREEEEELHKSSDEMELRRSAEESDNSMLSNGSGMHNAASEEDVAKLRKRAETSAQTKEKLKRSIQESSKRHALQKYGEGPHFVKFDLDFSFQKDGKDVSGPSSFVVKLAPLTLMPHSVYVFLEMIDRGLWDGCSFVLNAMHFLKASPLPYAANAGEDKATPFYETGLEKPAFQEYSESFPHKPYTLGFIGSDVDGMGFYINTLDNTQLHGPGKHQINGDGDPCFGEIVSGLDTVDHLRSVQTVNGAWIKERVGILTAKRVESFP